MKIAVFLPNWIGDAVMATPALRAVRTRFPEAEIVGVAQRYVADVLAGLDLLDRTLIYDRKNADGVLTERELLKAMRSERFDSVLLLTNSFRTAWLAWRSGAKRRVGFARDWRSWLLTDRVPARPKKEPYPCLDSYNELAAALGCNVTTRDTELAVLPEDEARYEEFWSERDWQLRAAGVVTLNPGGAFGAAKHWPVEHFATLARRIVDDLEMTPHVLCGPGEVEQAREIVRLADREQVQTLADGPIGLGVTKAAIRDSRLLVTTDSGPRHFAQPFGVPVVTLFGPTHIAWSETHYDRGVHLQIDLDCGPCQQRVCPLGHLKCMTDLTPDRVFAAASDLLQRRDRDAA